MNFIKKYFSKITLIIVICFLAIIGFMFFYNLKNNNDFLKANFIQLLPLILTVLLSFVFVQRLTDQRRKIDFYQRMLDEIQKIIDTNSDLFSAKPEAIFLQKSVANKILHLQEHSFAKIVDDLNYIDQRFTALRELYAENKNDLDSETVQRIIRKDKINISDKIDKIKLTLYDI